MHLGERGVGLRLLAFDEACGLRAQAGSGVPDPVACGRPDPSELATGFVAGLRGSCGQTPKAWWQMAWSERTHAGYLRPCTKSCLLRRAGGGVGGMVRASLRCSWALWRGCLGGEGRCRRRHYPCVDLVGR